MATTAPQLPDLATLTVGGRFDHFRDRLGVGAVPQARVDTLRLESPFDYARQALVLVAADMPEPQEPSFGHAVREAVLGAVERSRGRAFVLFTSYRLLDRTFRALAGKLADIGSTR